MRNIWKGLFLGAVTGAAIGITLDFIYGAGDQLTSATREARRRAPDAMDWAATVTKQARQRLLDADVPEQVRSLAKEIAESDFGKQVAGATTDAAATGRKAVRRALDNARDTVS